MILIDRYGESAAAALGALSDAGYVMRLEREVERRTRRAAVAVCSPDAALHTALHICGVRRGDYVFVPTFTFYSYIATVENMGGVPVFLDCDPITRCVSAAALDTALLWARLQNKPPQAVVIDNAFGSLADYDVLMPLCKSYDVATVEIAACGFNCKHGALPYGVHCDVGAVGFDKRLHGGGAVVLCDDKADAQMFIRARYSDGENHDYRLNNIVAALDLAGLVASDKISARARKNLDALCREHECIAKPTVGDSGRYALCDPPCGVRALVAAGYTVKQPPCVHTLDRYRDYPYFEHEPGYSVCSSFSHRCLIDMDFGAVARVKLSRMLRE